MRLIAFLCLGIPVVALAARDGGTAAPRRAAKGAGVAVPRASDAGTATAPVAPAAPKVDAGVASVAVDAGTPSTAAPVTETAVSVEKEVDALWPKRDQPGVLAQIDAKLTEALHARPADYELLWRAARHRMWVADGATDDRLKKQMGREGWMLGDQARQKEPNRVEGQYYAGACLGLYSQAVGILKALGEGLEPQYNERIDASIRINPGFEDGGPVLAKGRYWFELPWPKRDLAKSKQILTDAVNHYPMNIRGYVYLSETLLKDGDKQAAKQLLQRGLSLPVDYDPPEGRRALAMGRKLQAENKELQ